MRMSPRFGPKCACAFSPCTAFCLGPDKTTNGSPPSGFSSCWLHPWIRSAPHRTYSLHWTMGLPHQPRPATKQQQRLALVLLRAQRPATESYVLAGESVSPLKQLRRRRGAYHNAEFPSVGSLPLAKNALHSPTSILSLYPLVCQDCKIAYLLAVGTLSQVVSLPSEPFLLLW